MSRTYVAVLRLGSWRSCWRTGCLGGPLRKLCRQMLPQRFRYGKFGMARCSMLPQKGLDDLHGDRCGRIGTEAAALDYDADRDLRVSGRGEAGKHGVVETRVVRSVLGRTGLARDTHAGHARAGGRQGRSLGTVSHAD